MTEIFFDNFLDRCKNVTDFYETKYGTWSINKQILKIYEEVAEVQRSAKNMDQKQLKLECCDVILAVITIFNQLGTSNQRINEIMEETLQKVERRCV